MRARSMRTRLAWAFSLVAVASTLITVLGLNFGMSFTLHTPLHKEEIMGNGTHGIGVGPMGIEMRDKIIGLILRWSMISAAGAIALAVLGSQAVSRRLAHPLRQLADTTSGLGLGNLDTRVPEEGDSEVVELAKAFNTMAKRLESEDTARRQLLADVTHELNHPISILQGRMEMILDGVTPVDPEHIVALQDEVMRVNRLVQDLRDISLAEVGALSLNRKPVDIAQVAADLVETLQPVARAKSISLTAECNREVPLVDGDEGRLRQVILNLIGNALRHTPERGIVRVETCRRAGTVTVSVSDTGSGIPASDLPHVFDRFYRTDVSRSRSTGGSGLGLAIAKSLTELHGGRIEVQSRLFLATYL